MLNIKCSIFVAVLSLSVSKIFYVVKEDLYQHEKKKNSTNWQCIIDQTAEAIIFHLKIKKWLRETDLVLSFIASFHVLAMRLIKLISLFPHKMREMI